MSELAADVESTGPIQLLVIAFPHSRFRGEILPELDRLKRKRIIRVLDLLIIRKDAGGNVVTATGSDLEFLEATALGAYLGSLAGHATGDPAGAERGAIEGAAQLADGHVFDEEDVFRLTEALSDDTTAALLLIQHLWARPLLDAVDEAGGIELMNEWIAPENVLTIGAGISADG